MKLRSDIATKRLFRHVAAVALLSWPLFAAVAGFAEERKFIIFLANMQIGYFTPPVGMNLFIASYRFNKPILLLFRATLPFLAILLAAVLVITYWPALSLVLVGRS